jgi:hypothetical protein
MVRCFLTLLVRCFLTLVGARAASLLVRCLLTPLVRGFLTLVGARAASLLVQWELTPQVQCPLTPLVQPRLTVRGQLTLPVRFLADALGAMRMTVGYPNSGWIRTRSRVTVSRILLLSTLE